MKLTKSENADANYLAVIVEAKQLRAHSNADRLQILTVFGNDCIVGLDTVVGDKFCYFPLECQISAKLLSYCNLFSDPVLNRDGKSKGYFSGGGNSSGRVKAVRLRGEKSAGFLLNLSTLAEFLECSVNDLEVGTEFDTANGEEICKKYVPHIQRSQGANEPKVKVPKKDSIVQRLLPNQFRFHGQTSHFGRNSHLLSPDDIISCTQKLHGQNFVASKVLTRPILTWKDKIAKFLGVKVIDKEYQFIYSSRNVVKSQRDGSIGDDQWGIHAKELEQKLPPGITVVGELVGFTPNGNGIQKSYDYSCEPLTSKLKVFRITYTDPLGEVVEFSWLDIVRFCEKYNLETVPCEYFGRAGNLFNIDEDENWSDEFLKMLTSTFLDKKCRFCKNDVPNEGVVIALENKINRPVFKHKSFTFLQKESADRDAGIYEEG